MSDIFDQGHLDQLDGYYKEQLKKLAQARADPNEAPRPKTNLELLEDMRFLVFHLKTDGIFKEADKKMLMKMLALYIQDYEEDQNRPPRNFPGL